MKRIGILTLVTAAALMASAVLSSGARVGPDPRDASRAATFIGLRGKDTLFVERVRDAPGGFHGEVSLTSGTVWIRYRVELGPDETIRRYELDMTSIVGAEPGVPTRTRSLTMPDTSLVFRQDEDEERAEIPLGVLIARRERDSILIEPLPGTGVSGRRLAVPPSAFMASTEMAVFEQAIRHGLRLGGTRAEFPVFSAWTGQRLDAVVVRGSRGKVRLETSLDIWEFTLDRHRRIVSGTRVSSHQARANDPWRDIRVVRLDPSGANPLNQPLSIGESEEGRRRDRLDSLFKVLDRQESEFRATLAFGRPVHELAATLDSQLVAFRNRGGAYNAERCLEAVTALRGRPGGDPLAERYARWAVVCADTHNVLWFGEQGMVEARIASRMALAEILAGLGRRDSAILLLRAAKAVPREYDNGWLRRRDVCIQMGNVLAAEGRTEEAIAELFEAVAVDTTRQGIAEPLRRSLTDLWRREFPADTTLATRIGRAGGANCASAIMGGGVKELDGDAAPKWSALDLRGRRHSSRTGRPLVLVFWGGWSETGLKMVRLAETWHRRRAETGVDIVTFDWELPGSGPLSERIARRAARSENLTVPVLLDHDREIWTRFGGEGFPQVFLVNRQGRKVRTVFGGFWTAETLPGWVEALGRDELR
jgi:hypothetical protein